MQMVRYGDHVWATQFHAEMDAQAMQTRMDFFADYGYFSPEDYDAIVKGLPSRRIVGKQDFGIICAVLRGLNRCNGLSVATIPFYACNHHNHR